MPIGIIAVVTCIVVGGTLGAVGGKYLPDKLKSAMPMAFAIGSMGMGIVSIVKMNALPPVILSLLLGTAIGTLCGLERLLRHAGEWVAKMFMHGGPADPALRSRNLEYFSIAVILFCTGPTGLYGSMQAALSGDNSLLMSKCFLDLFTAGVFAASAGIVIALLAAPVFVVFSLCYLLGGFIAPLITPAMLGDFSGCGGMLILATGFRMAEIKMFPVSDMLPALVLIMPLSHLWSFFPF